MEYDLRNLSKEELIKIIIERKENSWLLKEMNEEQIREWAQDREPLWLADIIAAWNRDHLRSEGLLID